MTSPPPARPDIDVTVVIAVYNTGPDIEPGIRSLLGQTVPVERREFIFVDDGSTDGTGDRLDQLAAEHPDVTVIHQENSGWPGKPRNVGIEAAKGEFIQFMDHDDSLGPEALERLVSFARANAADIVIGKVTSPGNFRPVAHPLFTENVGRCSIYDTALITTMTPHKMFRRSFLLENQLRFPEGRVRLEDQLFMIKCYFATRAVAILSDYPCYFYCPRSGGENAAGQYVTPTVYQSFVRKVLEVIVAKTEPGEFRDRLNGRYVRQLARQVASQSLRENITPSQLADVMEQNRRTINDWFNEAAIAAVPTMQQLQTRAILADQADVLQTITQTFRSVRTDLLVETISWSGPECVLEVSVRFFHPDGSPVTFQPVDGGWTLDPTLMIDGLTAPVRSTEEILSGTSVALHLSHRVSDIHWHVPAQLQANLEPVDGMADGSSQLVVTGSATIDPAVVGGVHPLDSGVWDVAASVSTVDFQRTVRTRVATTSRTATAPAVLADPPALVSTRATPRSRSLRLVVRRKSRVLRTALRDAIGPLRLHRKTLEIPIDLHLIPEPAQPGPPLIAEDQQGKRTRLATTTSRGDSTTVLAAELGSLPPGSYQLQLKCWNAIGPITVARIKGGRLSGWSLVDAGDLTPR